MFNYNININKLIQENLPALLRGPFRLDFYKALFKPLRVLHAELLLFIDLLLYESSYNGGMASLQAAINDKFDKTLRRITVVDAFFDPTYIYYVSENKPAPILYYVWENTLPFAANHFCLHNGIIYQANATPSGTDVPGVSPKWTATTRKPPYIRHVEEYTSLITFYVKVPFAITFDEKEMKALIAKYIFAGPGYLIRVI